LDCRHVCKTCAYHDALQAGKQKEVHPPHSPDLAPIYIYIHIYIYGARNSSVGIATSYGLGEQGIESWWGRDFPQLSRPALWPTQPPIQWVPGRGVDHPTHLAPRLKKE
jgi:hypothetical protein